MKFFSIDFQFAEISLRSIETSDEDPAESSVNADDHRMDWRFDPHHHHHHRLDHEGFYLKTREKTMTHERCLECTQCIEHDS